MFISYNDQLMSDNILINEVNIKVTNIRVNI